MAKVSLCAEMFRDVKSPSLAQTIDVSEKPGDEEKSRKRSEKVQGQFLLHREQPISI